MKLFRLKSVKSMREPHLSEIYEVEQGKGSFEIRTFRNVYLSPKQMIEDLLKNIPNINDLSYSDFINNESIECLSDLKGPWILSLHSGGGSDWELVSDVYSWIFEDLEEAMKAYKPIQDDVDATRDNDLILNLYLGKNSVTTHDTIAEAKVKIDTKMF